MKKKEISTERRLLQFVLENFEIPNVAKKIDSVADTNLYDINYFHEKLNVLETFEEGEFTLANRI